MASIKIVNGEGAGAVRRLGAEVTLGRNPDTTIPLNDTGVSRRHAIIRRKDSYFVIIDCGSANGTLVNGRPLERFVPQPLYDGDEIEIGAFRLLFLAEGEEPPGGSSKRASWGMLQRDALNPPPGAASGLTMVLTSGGKDTPVNATIDASAAGLLSVTDGAAPVHDAVRRLAAMVKVSQDLGVLTNPQALLEKIMNNIFDLFPYADRAFILLRDRQSGELSPAMGRSRAGASREAGEYAVSRTVVAMVVEKKQSVLTTDAQQDERFASQQSIVNLSIRSLMCAPFIWQDEVLGIISVDTLFGRHAFTADDLAMLTGIAGQAAIAIKNAELYAKAESETRTRTQLARYLSPDIVEGVLDGTIPLTLGGERKCGTVLFCDIVGFTALSERLGALEVVNLLNSYFCITTAIVTRNRGTLHKFGGDMIMAFWNVMFSDEQAQVNAIRAGVEMQAAVWEFGCELAALGQPPIYIGIGCNTGDFAGGNIGGAHRMEYTIIGDNVNLAQRIESLASRWQVFVARETYLPAAGICSATLMPPALVKGKSSPIHVYSIRGILRDSGFMSLSIPVAITRPDGADMGQGFLYGIQLKDQRIQMRIPASSVCAVGERIRCTFECRELVHNRSLSATIAAIHEPSAESFHSRIIELTQAEGHDALAMLKPGALEISKKSWDDMTRQ